jgi:MFS family permease
LADKRRACEAQVIVGASLVLGSALGPLLAGLIIGPLGYRGMFGSLAVVGLIATAIVAMRIPETISISKDDANVDERRLASEISAHA